MRVLAHIHTFNDADIVDQTIEALLRQTRPVDGILVVDNGSTDGTLEQPSLKKATILRHQENLGTSGAVCSGFRFALERGYDWIWIFDADSVPAPDALEKLLSLYDDWPRSLKDETAFLAGQAQEYGVRPRNGLLSLCGLWPILSRGLKDQTASPKDWAYEFGIPRRSGRNGVFSRWGLWAVEGTTGERYYSCHVANWSGALYRLAAVRQIGLPNPDYVLDWGEVEYGYRVMKAGYRGFTYRDAIHHHDIRGYASVRPVEVKRGAATATILEFPPFRCYYRARNGLYLTLYDFAELRPWIVLRVVLNLVRLMARHLLRPGRHGAQIFACMRGIWHGLTGNIAARY